jgi:hypothetical protein
MCLSPLNYTFTWQCWLNALYIVDGRYAAPDNPLEGGLWLKISAPEKPAPSKDNSIAFCAWLGENYSGSIRMSNRQGYGCEGGEPVFDK